MSFLEKVGAAGKAVKGAINGMKKTIAKIKKFAKFAASGVGYVVSILAGIAIVIVLVLVAIRTVHHALGKWFDADYGGISTDEDYAVIVGSLSNAGYDALIDEKNYQEFNAYEYSVLIDVAEYLYDGQTGYLAGDSEYYEVVDAVTNVEKNGKVPENNKVASPIYMPYLSVKVEYNEDLISYDNWIKNTIEGQGSARYGFTNPADVGLEGTGYMSAGGNLNCFPPIITYEFKTNPYEETKGSLVPYITVLREESKFRYYTVGSRGKDSTITKADYTGSGKYAKNSENGGVLIDTTNISDINLLEYNALLNTFNGYLPKNMNLANDIMRVQVDAAGNKLPFNTKTVNYSDSANWAVADSKFGQQLYYTEAYGATAYKFSLQQLIDRYLPKATLLAAWYETKDETQDLESSFDVDELIYDIKTVYNYYCLKNEKSTTEKVSSIQYNANGEIIRDDNGNALKEETEKKYAKTNKETFIKFGQAGVESNRYSVYEVYNASALSSNGENVPRCDNSNVTGTSTKEVVPVVSDLLSEYAEFLEDFGLTVSFEYEYEYSTYGDVSEEEKLVEHVIVVKETDNLKKITVSADRLTIKPGAIKSSQYKKYNGGIYKILETTTVTGGTKYKVNYIKKASTQRGTSSSTINLDYNSGDVGDGESKNTISDYLFYNAIKNAENSMLQDELVKNAQAYGLEKQEKQFVNYEYLFPQPGTVEYDESTGEVKAKPVDYFEGYHQKFPFYNFAVDGNNNEETRNNIRNSFIDKILEKSKDLTTEQAFANILLDLIDDKKSSLTQKNGKKIPSGATITIDTDSIKVTNYSSTPVFKKAKELESRAVFDITEETLTLTMNVPQKRMSVMLVTEVESWAKSTKYTNNIVNNPFNPDNYRYVMPHSFFGFGLKVFQITEDSEYRWQYYQRYFSNLNNNGEPGVKEADIMTMFLSWEKYAESNETAYALMRDLYKLVMAVRKNGGVLDTAYTYLYLNDSIWDFDEGITQMKFWTERLVAESPGMPDALSDEEQKVMKTKKDEIYWQVVDYENYEECQNGDTSMVYALFPHGNPYVRSYFMMQALETGRFYDGNYKEGHGGADWSARSITKQILNPETETVNGKVAAKIYDYALEQLELQKALNGGSSYTNSIVDDVFHTNDSASATYSSAEEQLRSELEEYSVNSPIVSVAPGIVMKAGFNCYGGFTVTIKHTSGDGVTPVQTSYSHMKRWPNVQVGDIVGAGTLLGYEGTTGNSGGYHLHMGCKVGGEAESPAKYMGPIFAPFYNKEKAMEVRASTSGKNILASEYYSLIRTVILDKVLDTGTPYEENEVIKNNKNVVFLQSGGFITENGKTYIAFNTDTTSNDYNTVTASMLKQGSKYVIKEGAADPKYWLCTIEVEKIEDGSSDDPNTDGILPGVFIQSDGSTSKLRVVSAEEIEFNDIDFGSIAVKTTKWSSESTNVIWGNNVPIYPLIEDSRNAIDISSLNNIKRYTPGKEADDINGEIFLKAPKYDVRAMSEFFDSNSTIAKTRTQLPVALYLRMSDIENPFVVAFYDGPVNKDFVVPDSDRFPGGMITDLVQLQKSMKAKGIITDEDNITLGEYDEAMEKVVNEKLIPLLKEYGYSPVGGLGIVSGDASSGNVSFGVHNVIYYNMYVTYGEWKTAKEVGEQAVYLAAIVSGLDPTFLAGVASCESAFQPSVESHEFPSGANGDAIPGRRYEYKGQPKNLRRAQGLLQVMPSLAMSIFSEMGITDTEVMIQMMRTPYTNAFAGAQYIRKNIEKIGNNEYNAYYNMQEAAKAPGIRALAADIGASPETIVTYAAAAYMYNKGPNANSIKNGEFYRRLATMQYTKGSGEIPSIDNTGYAVKVLRYMLQQAKKKTY